MLDYFEIISRGNKDELKEQGYKGKFVDLIKYSEECSTESSDPDELHSLCVLRNNIWKDEGNEFLRANNYKLNYNFSSDFEEDDKKHYLVDGKHNNSFYKHKLRYDITVPLKVFRRIVNYYYHNLEKQTNEKYVEFILRNIDNIMVFCYLLSYHKDSWISTMHSKRDKTPMPSKFIESFINRDYKNTINFLEKIGIIEVDRFYRPSYLDQTGNNGVCRHYKFIEETEETVVYQVTKRTIINKFYNVFEEDIEYTKKNSNTIKDKVMNEWFSSNFRLEDKAIENRAKDYDGFSYYYTNVLTDKEISLYGHKERLRRFTIGRDQFGFRLYHPFLNINRELRKHIVITGEVDNNEIDISNSHPYFFSMLLSEKFLSNFKSIFTPEEYRVFHSIAADVNLNEKISMFQDITSSGVYYSFLEKNVNRTDVKTLNMYYFYGRINRSNVIYKFFENHFPFINKIKRDIYEMSGHKRLCQIMQRIEAMVMIDGVHESLKADFIAVLPLHDAFMFNRKHYSVVEKRIKKFLKFYGVTRMPVLNRKYKVETQKVQDVFNDLRKKNFNTMLNKNMIYEELNFILKQAGINGRIFKDDMKKRNQEYIDTRFEENRHLITDEMADRYIELRMMLDRQEFNMTDFSDYFEGYKESMVTRKKYLSNKRYEYVKLDPVEYLNYTQNFTLKNRVNNKQYVY